MTPENCDEGGRLKFLYSLGLIKFKSGPAYTSITFTLTLISFILIKRYNLLPRSYPPKYTFFILSFLMNFLTAMTTSSQIILFHIFFHHFIGTLFILIEILFFNLSISFSNSSNFISLCSLQILRFTPSKPTMLIFASLSSIQQH